MAFNSNGIEYSGVETIGGQIPGGDGFALLGEPPAQTNLVVTIEVYDKDYSLIGKVTSKWKNLNQAFLELDFVVGAGDGRLGPNDSKDLLHVEVEDGSRQLWGKISFAGNMKSSTAYNFQMGCGQITGNGHGENEGFWPVILGLTCR